MKRFFATHKTRKRGWLAAGVAAIAGVFAFHAIAASVHFAAVAAVVGGAVWFAPAVGASLFAAAVAVLLPQAFVLYIAGRTPQEQQSRRVFYFWSLKFSFTILLLAVSLRALHTADLLAPLAFFAGVVGGVGVNLFLAYRQSKCAEEQMVVRPIPVRTHNTRNDQ